MTLDPADKTAFTAALARVHLAAQPGSALPDAILHAWLTANPETSVARLATLLQRLITLMPQILALLKALQQAFPAAPDPSGTLPFDPVHDAH